ncbi:MAG: IS66 family transposase [Candidatus Hadarchaeota archaeon]
MVTEGQHMQKKENQQVEIPEIVRKAIDEYPELKPVFDFLLDKIRFLEARLRKYENPHVPSSKQIVKETKAPREPKPRGAPENHKGATREKPAPDMTVELKPNSCPKPGCGSKGVRVLKKRRKTVGDIIIIKITTEYIYYECECEDCSTQFVTGCEELPKEGNFGPNISSLWAALHYVGTVPFARLAAISENCFCMPITPKGVEDAIYRAAEVFEPNFRRIRSRVGRSKYARSDETTYSFNGEKYWAWNISGKRDTLVLLRETRGSAVLKEVFGDFLDGILNSDCFKGYDKFKAGEYQKCWAHVLRDAEDLAKHDDDGKWLHRELSRMYRYILKVKREGGEGSPRVERWVKRSKERIMEFVEKNYRSKAVLNLALRLSKYRDHWFTCLKYEFVEPTNNASERDIRKLVVARKISGAHRSELGMRSREIMMSTILTSQKRGENPFEFIRGGIEKHNMDCSLKPP